MEKLLGRLGVARRDPQAIASGANASTQGESGMFWQQAFEGAASVSWPDFESAIRQQVDPAVVDAAAGPLRAALERNGAVAFGPFSATCGSAPLRETISKMAEQIAAAEEMFTIVVRDATSREPLPDFETFVMVQSTSSLADVRRLIVESFAEDDEEVEEGHEFMAEGSFSFYIKDGKLKVRRSQERSIKGWAAIKDACVIQDTKKTSLSAEAATPSNSTVAEPKAEEARPPELSPVKPAKADDGGAKFEETGPADAAAAAASDEGLSSAGAQSADAAASAAAIIAQARTIHAENMTAEAALIDPVLATSLRGLATKGGTAEEVTAFLKDISALCDAESQELAKVRAEVLVSRYLKEDSPMNVGLGADAKQKLASLVQSEDGSAITSELQKTQAALKESLAAPMEALRAQLRQGTKAAKKTVPGDARKRVVVIGSGYAGAPAAMMLDRNPLLHVTLVDTKEYFENTPMALRLMVDSDPAFFDLSHVTHTSYVKNGTVKIGRCVSVREGHILVGAAREVVPFDYLLICTGSHYRSDIKTDMTSLEYRRKQFQAVKNQIGEASSVVVLGSGLVGTEMVGESLDYFPEKRCTMITRSSKFMPRIPGAHEKVMKAYEGRPNLEMRFQEEVVLAVRHQH